MCGQSFDLSNTKLTLAEKQERFNKHYCQIAERNPGHFVRYDIRNEDDWLIRSIVNSPLTSPSNTHMACVSEELCIPGRATLQ